MEEKRKGVGQRRGDKYNHNISSGRGRSGVACEVFGDSSRLDCVNRH